MVNAQWKNLLFQIYPVLENSFTQEICICESFPLAKKGYRFILNNPKQINWPSALYIQVRMINVMRQSKKVTCKVRSDLISCRTVPKN